MSEEIIKAIPADFDFHLFPLVIVFIVPRFPNRSYDVRLYDICGKEAHATAVHD